MPIEITDRKGRKTVLQDHIWQEPIFWLNTGCVVITLLIAAYVYWK